MHNHYLFHSIHNHRTCILNSIQFPFNSRKFQNFICPFIIPPLSNPAQINCLLRIHIPRLRDARLLAIIPIITVSIAISRWRSTRRRIPSPSISRWIVVLVRRCVVRGRWGIIVDRTLGLHWCCVGNSGMSATTATVSDTAAVLLVWKEDGRMRQGGREGKTYKQDASRTKAMKIRMPASTHRPQRYQLELQFV